MGDDPMSREAYTRVYTEATAGGTKKATHAGEQRHKEGKGLHELVDPKAMGVIRFSISWLEPNGEATLTFYLFRGTAILIEYRLDTTGSMHDNVEIAMKALPRTYKLLTEGDRAVLKRYDPQIITSIFGDIVDDYILCRSQAEFDERIATQMTYMVPEGKGGDTTEDPQYGLFGAAYLTNATIKKLGLKSYDFTITDAPARSRIDIDNLKRVFGPEVIEKCAENGHVIDAKNLPSTREIARELLKTTHAFALIIDEDEETIKCWNEILGRERVVLIPRAELLPEVQAVIIGLTEGTLELSTVESFLIEEAKLSASEAAQIKRAVAGIPIGAQAMLENFDKIPLKGDIFAKKGDLWPIEKAKDAKAKTKPGKDIWD
jgi:hypothetical protein